jgi:nitrous oxidase accessory protein NosD
MKKMKLAFILLIILSLALVMVSVTGKAQLPTSANIIRIRSDGTVEGTDKIQRNGDVYTLTENLASSVGSDEAFIFVERDNIVFDGAGRTIQGTGHGTAIYMLRRQSVTVKNFNIIGFETGINFWTVWNWPADSKYWGLPPASKNQILNNNITVVGTVFESDSMEAGWAIYLQEAIGTLISGNTITSQDPEGGIFFGFTTGETSLLNNRFVTCGLYIRSSNQTTALGNTVDGKPLVFLDGASNQIINDAGLIYLFNCENMTIKDIQLSIDYGKTIQLSGTRNTEVTDCNGYITLIDSDNNNIHNNFPKVIDLSGSNYNKIFSNTIVTTGVCIQLYGSSNHNNIYENILLNSNDSVAVAMLAYSGKNAVGISLGDGCQYNDIHGNNILNHTVAIECSNSLLNIIYSNNILNSNVGVVFSSSGQNRIFQNNIEKCGYAIRIVGSDNAFYHNNFVGNEHQVFISHQTLFSSNIILAYSTNNTFDSGYPSGGNYWSDYNGADADGDGIGDTPYVVYENYTDRYPLIKPVVLDTTPPVLDTTPPAISIISPENKTYTSSDVSLTFTLSEKASWIGYSVDGQNSVTIAGNTTLNGLSHGSHNLTVYATDKTGNKGASETITFTMAEETVPEPFPTELAIAASGASVATVGVGLLVYFKKRNPKP